MCKIRKILEPKSKYDKSIPYTYEAKVDILSGQRKEPKYEHYFADTICGLIEYLDEHNIGPDEAQLNEVYRNKKIIVKKDYCITPDGKWLFRPDICDSMHAHYKGHSDEHSCSYRDRDREGSGPY